MYDFYQQQHNQIWVGPCSCRYFRNSQRLVFGAMCVAFDVGARNIVTLSHFCTFAFSHSRILAFCHALATVNLFSLFRRVEPVVQGVMTGASRLVVLTTVFFCLAPAEAF